MPLKFVIRLVFSLLCLTTVLVVTSGWVGGLRPAGQWISLALETRFDSNLYVFDIQNRLLANLTKDIADEAYPTLSPDSRKIVFTTQRNVSFDIFMVDILTGKLTQLTDNVAYDAFPNWSPDGSHIVFVSGYNNADIYTLDIHNPLPKRLTDNPGGDTTPSWSPDGNWIAYVSGQGTDPASLYLIDAHCPGHCDQDAIPLTRHGYDFFPTWSPDGKHIAYISDQGGRRGIFLLETACLLDNSSCAQQAPHLLALGHIIMSRLNWSEDGRQVLFLANEDGFPELYAVDANCAAGSGCAAVSLTAIGRSFLGLRF